MWNFYLETVRKRCSVYPGTNNPTTWQVSLRAGFFFILVTVFLLHRVTILEAKHRVGGRVFTKYGDGWYADLGAMRFPPQHRIFQGVVKHLGLPTTRCLVSPGKSKKKSRIQETLTLSACGGSTDTLKIHLSPVASHLSHVTWPSPCQLVYLPG